jgi:hypothetical protein
MGTDKEGAWMQSPGEWGGETTNLLQASLRGFRFFLANPALRDHPCRPINLRIISHPIFPIRVFPCYWQETCEENESHKAPNLTI